MHCLFLYPAKKTSSFQLYTQKLLVALYGRDGLNEKDIDGKKMMQGYNNSKCRMRVFFSIITCLIRTDALHSSFNGLQALGYDFRALKLSLHIQACIRSHL